VEERELDCVGDPEALVVAPGLWLLATVRDGVRLCRALAEELSERAPERVDVGEVEGEAVEEGDSDAVEELEEEADAGPLGDRVLPAERAGDADPVTLSEALAAMETEGEELALGDREDVKVALTMPVAVSENVAEGEADCVPELLCEVVAVGEEEAALEVEGLLLRLSSTV
jgi:hypothetical protein